MNGLHASFSDTLIKEVSHHLKFTLHLSHFSRLPPYSPPPQLVGLIFICRSISDCVDSKGCETSSYPMKRTTDKFKQ